MTEVVQPLCSVQAVEEGNGQNSTCFETRDYRLTCTGYSRPRNALVCQCSIFGDSALARRVVGERDPEGAAFAGVEGMHVTAHAVRHFPLRDGARIEEGAINARARGVNVAANGSSSCRIRNTCETSSTRWSCVRAFNRSVFVCRPSGSSVFGRSLGWNRPEIHGAATGVQRLCRFPTAHVEGVRDDPSSRL